MKPILLVVLCATSALLSVRSPLADPAAIQVGGDAENTLNGNPYISQLHFTIHLPSTPISLDSTGSGNVTGIDANVSFIPTFANVDGLVCGSHFPTSISYHIFVNQR